MDFLTWNLRYSTAIASSSMDSPLLINRQTVFIEQHGLQSVDRHESAESFGFQRFVADDIFVKIALSQTVNF